MVTGVGATAPFNSRFPTHVDLNLIALKAKFYSQTDIYVVLAINGIGDRYKEVTGDAKKLKQKGTSSGRMQQQPTAAAEPV